MNKKQFISETFEEWAEYPDAKKIEAAIRKAQTTCGVTIESASEDSNQRLWLANRVERNVIWSLLRDEASSYDYAGSPVKQVFDSYERLLKMLDAEWEDDFAGQVYAGKIGSSLTNGTGVFGAVGPGYRYDKFGVPL